MNKAFNMISDFSSSQFWAGFVQLYNATKSYLLLIEEIEPQHSTIIQPVKEQRDALDHIIRAYVFFERINVCEDDEQKDSLVKSLTEEFKRANSHLERAINDCADILSIILREKIAAYLSEFSYKEIVSVWPDYPSERKYIIRVDEKISKLRNRNISNGEDFMDEYNEVINKLKELYYKVTEDIYPKLCT